MARISMAKNVPKSDEFPEYNGESPYEAAEVTETAEAVHIRSFALPGIFLILLFAALKLASEVFVPLAVALVLKILFASVVRGASRLHIPAPVSAAVVLIVFVGGVGFGIYQLAVPAAEWMAKLPQSMRQIEVKLRGIKQSVQKLSKAGEEVGKLADLGSAGDKTQKVEVKRASVGATLLEPTQAFLVGAGLTLVLLYFLLASGDLFLRKLVSVLPSLHDKKLAVEISHQIEHDVSTYLLAITIVNIVFGTAIGIAMHFLGLPNPILWGAMAGLLHYIPFLGAMIGISVVTMVALLTLGSLGTVALVPITYLALNMLEEYIVLPLVVGRRLLLNPVVIFLWLIFWGWLWGVPGALIAVPLLAILKTICERVESLSPLAEFLGH
jgi:predicted PurR-regulated permease PerM